MLIDDGALVRNVEGWGLRHDLDTLSVPPTIQALLTARLDRLSPDERVVIGLAAIEGKVFHRGAVLALCERALRAFVDPLLGSLIRRDLIRPGPATFAGEDACWFRHQLIRDAAYAGLPKETRADLHERFADWLGSAGGDRTELEEIIAHHLEQTFRLRAELGPIDERTRAVGERAGSLLIQAGDRAHERGDASGAVALWVRAVNLLADDDPRMPRTVVAASSIGHYGDTVAQLLRNGLARVEAIGAREAAAGIRVAEARLLSDREPSLHPTERIFELHEEAERVIASADHRVLLGWARHSAGIAYTWRGAMSKAVGLFESILADPLASRDRTLKLVTQSWIGRSKLYGTTPVDEALRDLGRDPKHSSLHRDRTVGVLLALSGNIPAGRETCRQVLARDDELGSYSNASWLFAAKVELLDARSDVAEPMLRDLYDNLIRVGLRGGADSIVGLLARAMYENGHGEDALPILAVHMDTPMDDYEAIGLQRAATARILADSGNVLEAERLAREGVAALQPTEDLILHGQTLLALAHVLRVAHRDEEAINTARSALELFERKGDVPDVRRVRTFLGGG
jgi:tetratricopeptide (TPR) repeat protein